LNFEYLLDVILDKIIGDNDLRLSIFGNLAAYGMAVEEQAQKTLHTHLLVYINGWNETLRALHSSKAQTRADAEKTIVNFVDNVMSSELVSSASCMQTCPT
jgi:hypothetical protein